MDSITNVTERKYFGRVVDCVLNLAFSYLLRTWNRCLEDTHPVRQPLYGLDMVISQWQILVSKSSHALDFDL